MVIIYIIINEKPNLKTNKDLSERQDYNLKSKYIKKYTT